MDGKVDVIKKDNKMKDWIILILLMMVVLGVIFFERVAQGQEYSASVWGLGVTNAHSEDDKDHCLDGKFGGAVMGDISFRSDNITLRTGIAYYNIQFFESYRAKASDPREDTANEHLDLFSVMLRPGVRLMYETVEPYFAFGLSHLGHKIYGAGVSIRTSRRWSVDAEMLKFYSEEKRFSTLGMGLRYLF